MSYTVRLIKDVIDLEGLRESWDSLLTASDCDEVSLTFDWTWAWWSGFGEPGALYVLVCERDGMIVGIAPLMRSRRRIFWSSLRVITFMENAETPRAGFVLGLDRAGILAAFIRFLDAHQEDWDVIHLRRFLKASDDFLCLKQILQDGRMLFGVRPGLRSPYLDIRTSWKEYYAGRPAKLRKVLRNKINRMKKMGKYQVRQVVSGPEVRGALSAVFNVSQVSWKGKAGRSILATTGSEHFFRELSAAAASRGRLRIWLLELADETIAYEYHLVYGRKVTALRADFKQEYRDYSPGSVLDVHIVQSYFDEGVLGYDLCGSEDPYKKNWTRKVRKYVRISIYPKTMKGRLLFVLELKILFPAKRFLRRFEVLRKLKRGIERRV